MLCIGAGALLCIAPFLLEYQANVKLAEARGLTTVVAQVQGLERLAGQIANPMFRDCSFKKDENRGFVR